MIISGTQVRRWVEEDNNIYRDENGCYSKSPSKLQQEREQHNSNVWFSHSLGWLLLAWGCCSIIYLLVSLIIELCTK